MKFLILSLLLAVTITPLWSQETDPALVEQAINTIEDTAKDSLEQTKGHYPRLQRQGSLGQIQKVWNNPPKGAGVLNVTYSQGEVIPLVIREFKLTTIILPSWEKIAEIRVSDATSFEAEPLNHCVFVVKAIEFIGVDANMVVTGKSGNVYIFYLRSEGFNSVNISDDRVNVHVPGGAPQSFADPIRDDQLLVGAAKNSPSSQNKNSGTYPQELPPRIEDTNFQWAMSGKREDRDIAPLKVYDDGIRTWFYFGDRFDRQRLPIVFLVRDGVDTRVNFRIEDRSIVVMGVGVFSLRNGHKKICVYPSTLKKS